MPTLIHATRRAVDHRVNLSSNELLSRSLPAVHAAAAAGLTSALLSRYPVATETASRLAEYFGAGPDELLMTPGSDAALRHICAFHARGGGTTILSQDPNYAAWDQAAGSLGLTLRPARADRADPAVQGKDLKRLAESTSGALIAVSVPNGFSGGCVEDADLDELAAIAAERGHLLVIDACYQAFNGPLTAQFARRGGPVLVVQSLSKSHGLAGARIAVLGGDAALIARLEAGPLENAVSGAAFLAAHTALDHHDALAAIWAETCRTREHCAERLRRAGLSPLPSSANFVSVPVGTEAQAAAVVQLVSEAGYRIRDLSPLPGLGGCVRFTVADPETADAFLDALERAVTRIKEAPTCR